MNEFGRIPTGRKHTIGDVHLGIVAAGNRDTCRHEAELLAQGMEIRCDRCDIDAVLERVAPLIARRAVVSALREEADRANVARSTRRKVPLAELSVYLHARADEIGGPDVGNHQTASGAVHGGPTAVCTMPECRRSSVGEQGILARIKAVHFRNPLANRTDLSDAERAYYCTDDICECGADWPCETALLLGGAS